MTPKTIYLYLNLRSSLPGRRARCPGFVATWPRKPRKLEKTEKTRKNSRKLEKTEKTRARRSRSSSLGLAGALEMAARACSASLGRAKLLLRPARSGEIAAQAFSVGLAGALDYAAQGYLDEETCEKTFRKRYARVATRSVRLCSVRLCFEHGMLRFTLVYIYTSGTRAQAHTIRI